MFLSNDGRLLITRHGQPIVLNPNGPGGASAGVADTFDRADGALGAPWLGGGTWAIVNGKAVNTPVAGAEIIVNGGFATDTDWTKGTGWTIGSGVASKAAGTAANISETLGVIPYLWYAAAFTVSAFVAGSATLIYGQQASMLGVPRTANGSYTETGIIRGTTIGVRADASGNFSVDDVSMKPLALADILNLFYDPMSNFTAQVNVYRTDGFEGGLALLWDSPSSPTYGLVACVGRINGVVSAILYRFITSGASTIRSGSITYVDGAPLKVVKNGTTFQLFYNGIQVGTNATASDSEYINNHYYGMFASHPNVQLDNFSLR